MELAKRFYDSTKRFTTHVVELDLAISDEYCCELEATLSPDEMARADRFLFPDVRRRFVACRGALRQLLGELLDLDPANVKFRYGQWGKPAIDTDQIPRVEISVSHSGDSGLLAFAQQPIGVDLEVRQDRFRHRSIASQVISPHEQAAWETTVASTRDDAMMNLWVCKESLLKALGLGIAEGLQLVSFPIPIPHQGIFGPLRIDASLQIHLDDDGSCRMNHWIDAASWQLQLLPLGNHLFAALATSVRNERVQMYHWRGK